MTPHDARVRGPVRLVRGRFEARFDDVDAARAAARDARAVGFAVDVQQVTRGWLAVGRRFHAIATQHGGAFSQFVEEPPEILPTQVGETSEGDPRPGRV